MGVNGTKIFVCGSSRFSDDDVVSGMLDAVSEFLSMAGGSVAEIRTGGFGSADVLVAGWAERNGVKHSVVPMSVDDRDFFDREIPRSIMSNHRMFVDGAKRLSSSGVDLAMVIPGPDGKLGSTATNVAAMAEMASIKVLRGDVVFASTEAVMGEIRTEQKTAYANMNIVKKQKTTM